MITTLEVRIERGGVIPPPGAVAPEITEASITGTPQDGQVLTANATVTGDPTPTVAYQWQVVGVNISGQTASTITLDAAGMGLAASNLISCEIEATNEAGTATAEPTIVYAGSAAEQLEALLTGKTKSGMYDARGATFTPRVGINNIAGGMGRIASTLAARDPAYNATTGLLFDGGDDLMTTGVAAEAFTFDLLMRKTPGSTTGHILQGLRLYTSGSGVAVPGMTVDGVIAATRGALFTALDDGLWHHVRFTGVTTLTTMGLGNTSGSMGADVMLFGAYNEVETTGAALTELRAASAAWIEANKP